MSLRLFRFLPYVLEPFRFSKMNQQTHFNNLDDKLAALITTFDNGLDITSPDLASIASSAATTATNTGTVANCVYVAQNQLKTDLKTLNDTTIATNSGNLDAGVQRVCIASDDVNLSEVYQCIDHVNKHVEIDLNAFNGNMSATNQGFLSNGTLRTCIATDDINIANMNTEITKIGTTVDEATDTIHIDLKTLKGVTLENNQGYLSNGVPRVCIAQDDINVARLTGNSSGDLNAFNVNLRGIRFGGGDVDISSANGNVTSGTIRVCVADNDTNITTLPTISADIAQLLVILNDVWDSTAHALRTV